MADQQPDRPELQTAQLPVDWQGREKALATSHIQNNTILNTNGALLFNTVSAPIRAPLPSTMPDTQIASASVSPTHEQADSRTPSWMQTIAYNPEILNSLSAKTNDNGGDTPTSSLHAPFEPTRYLSGFFISIIHDGLTTILSIRPYYEAAFE